MPLFCYTAIQQHAKPRGQNNAQSRSAPLLHDQLRLHPLSNVVTVPKTDYTLARTDIIDRLLENHITEIHICGIDTDACVTAAALTLFDHNFRPVVLADACASTAGSWHHSAAITLLQRQLGDAQATESRFLPRPTMP